MHSFVKLRTPIFTTLLLGLASPAVHGQTSVPAERITVEGCSNLVFGVNGVRTFDPRGNSSVTGVPGLYQSGWKVEFGPGLVCDDIPYQNQPSSFFSTPEAPDRTNVNDSGIDPANLMAEGIDLSFFPSFSLSSELVLKPSLSYASDGLLERHGSLRYGSPKAWRAHYGEVVRVMGRMVNRDRELNQSSTSGGNLMNILSSSEISTYFVNAEGQQVNFYVDPDQYDNTNKPNEGVGRVSN